MSSEADERLPRGPKGERGETGARGPGVPRKVLLGFLYLSALMLLLAAANLLFTSSAVNRQAHDWCSALNLLTASPVPRPADPAGNPSREQAYQYYLVFLDLHRKFGC